MWWQGRSRRVLTLPLLARESPQSAGSVRLLDFFSSWSPASSMMGSSLVYEQIHNRGKPAGGRHANMSKNKEISAYNQSNTEWRTWGQSQNMLNYCSGTDFFFIISFHLYFMIFKKAQWKDLYSYVHVSSYALANCAGFSCFIVDVSHLTWHTDSLHQILKHYWKKENDKTKQKNKKQMPFHKYLWAYTVKGCPQIELIMISDVS